MKYDNKADLMDDLVQRAGCIYLSDLHSTRYAGEVRRALREIDATQYSVHDWNDAVQYISGSKEPLETPAQALAFLQDWLSEEAEEEPGKAVAEPSADA